MGQVFSWRRVPSALAVLLGLLALGATLVDPVVSAALHQAPGGPVADWLVTLAVALPCTAVGVLPGGPALVNPIGWLLLGRLLAHRSPVAGSSTRRACTTPVHRDTSAGLGPAAAVPRRAVHVRDRRVPVVTLAVPGWAAAVAGAGAGCRSCTWRLSLSCWPGSLRPSAPAWPPRRPRRAHLTPAATGGRQDAPPGHGADAGVLRHGRAGLARARSATRCRSWRRSTGRTPPAAQVAAQRAPPSPCSGAGRVDLRSAAPLSGFFLGVVGGIGFAMGGAADRHRRGLSCGTGCTTSTA